MTLETTALVVCLGMAVVTYLTRAGGVWVMGFVPITPRIESFLRHMASSVIVAIVVGGAVRGDAIANLALASSLVVMLITRQTFLALVAAMAVAAGARLLFGL